MMVDAYESLTSLRTLLMSRREEVKEKLARGRFEGEDGYREQVGRAKELGETIDLVSKQIKSLHAGGDDEGK